VCGFRVTGLTLISVNEVVLVDTVSPKFNQPFLVTRSKTTPTFFKDHRSWYWCPAHMSLIINSAVGYHYFLQGRQLPFQLQRITAVESTSLYCLINIGTCVTDLFGMIEDWTCGLQIVSPIPICCARMQDLPLGKMHEISPVTFWVIILTCSPWQ